MPLHHVPVIDEEPVAKDEEVRVARVALFHGEAMHLLPRRAVVAAAQDDDRGRRIHHVPVGATAEREVELPAETAQVGEGIVLAVVKHAPDRADGDARWRVGGDRGCREERECDDAREFHFAGFSGAAGCCGQCARIASSVRFTSISPPSGPTLLLCGHARCSCRLRSLSAWADSRRSRTRAG